MSRDTGVVRDSPAVRLYATSQRQDFHFADHDDPAERRHLLRLSLTAHAFASVEDTLRGGISARQQDR